MAPDVRPGIGSRKGSGRLVPAAAPGRRHGRARHLQLDVVPGRGRPYTAAKDRACGSPGDRRRRAGSVRCRCRRGRPPPPLRPHRSRCGLLVVGTQRPHPLVQQHRSPAAVTAWDSARFASREELIAAGCERHSKPLTSDPGVPRRSAQWASGGPPSSSISSGSARQKANRTTSPPPVRARAPELARLRAVSSREVISWVVPVLETSSTVAALLTTDEMSDLRRRHHTGRRRTPRT